MNASPELRMTLLTRVASARRLASQAVYSHLRPGPTPGRFLAPPGPEAQGLPLGLHRRHPAGRPLRRLLSARLAVRRRPRLAPAALLRDPPTGPACQPPRPRSARAT